jgi:hypothetical protein
MTQGEVKALVGLLAFIAGTLLGGVVNALVGRYAAFKESKGVALAIRAEIEALVRLATYRNYIALTDAIIVRLNDPTHVIDISDVFSVRVEEDYFSVFHALSPKLGLLGPLASSVVLAYAATKSLLDDLHSLRDMAQPVVEGQRTVSAEQARAYLLQVTVAINQLLRETVTIGTNTANALGAFAERRWLYVFK